MRNYHIVKFEYAIYQNITSYSESSPFPSGRIRFLKKLLYFELRIS